MRNVFKIAACASMVALVSACATHTVAPVSYKGAHSDYAGDDRVAASYSTVALRSSSSKMSVSSDYGAIDNKTYAKYTRDAKDVDMTHSYGGQVPNAGTLQTAVEIPSQCFASEKQTGQPVKFAVGAIIDQPQLARRAQMQKPNGNAGKVGFYCAAFHYAVDRRGRVTDIDTLYNSHPNIDGVNFAKMAKNALKGWQYQPGQVDKAPEKFTGLTTVFFFEAN